jgi:hypothetical protein
MMTTASSDTTIHPAFTSRTSQALLFEAAFRHSLYVLRKRRKGGVKTLGRFGETPDGAESKRVRCSKRGQAGKPSLPEPKFALNYLCAGYRKLFNHIGGRMRGMARRLKSDRFAGEIVTIEAGVPTWHTSRRPLLINRRHEFETGRRKCRNRRDVKSAASIFLHLPANS